MSEKYLVVYGNCKYKQICDSKSELINFIFHNLGLNTDYKIYNLEEDNSILNSKELKNLKENYAKEIKKQLLFNHDRLGNLLSELDKVRKPTHLKNAEILLAEKLEEIVERINDLQKQYNIITNE